MIVPGLLKESRVRIMDWLRLIIALGNCAAVEIGDLEKETRSKKVVKPNFATDYPGAVIREGELTLRAHEEGAHFHRHQECGKQKMGGTAR